MCRLLLKYKISRFNVLNIFPMPHYRALQTVKRNIRFTYRLNAISSREKLFSYFIAKLIFPYSAIYPFIEFKFTSSVLVSYQDS